MVGAAIVRALGHDATAEIVTRTHAQLDLTNQAQVRSFFQTQQINWVYLAAAHVGGIHANQTYPAEFIYQNLMIEANVIHQAWQSGVERLLFLGSSCIYPRLAPQPMAEEVLLSGKLEPTNEPYAIAKIAGIKLCESYNRQYGTDYRSVMPTNLYGPGDNYHPENSHVIPALLRRFHEAKMNSEERVVVWGTGTPLREFLYVDDLADACVHVMDLARTTYETHTAPTSSHINIGTGDEITIQELAELLASVIGYRGSIEFDASKPDGTPRKLIANDKLTKLGWRHKMELETGLKVTYSHYINSLEKID